MCLNRKDYSKLNRIGLRKASGCVVWISPCHSLLILTVDKILNITVLFYRRITFRVMKELELFRLNIRSLSVVYNDID